MIVVTRLNGTDFGVNPDLIERCHSSPDTRLVMVDGTTYIVTQTMQEVIELIIQYRASILTLAFEDKPADFGQRQLSLVHTRPTGTPPATTASHSGK